MITLREASDLLALVGTRENDSKENGGMYMN